MRLVLTDYARREAAPFCDSSDGRLAKKRDVRRAQSCRATRGNTTYSRVFRAQGGVGDKLPATVPVASDAMPSVFRPMRGNMQAASSLQAYRACDRAKCLNQSLDATATLQPASLRHQCDDVAHFHHQNLNFFF